MERIYIREQIAACYIHVKDIGVDSSQLVLAEAWKAKNS